MIRIRPIPWEDFNEDEIHELLAHFLGQDGWEVYNIHRIQRSEEPLRV